MIADAKPVTANRMLLSDGQEEGRFAMSAINQGQPGYAGRIIRDPGICGGEPVFKGTRVTLRTVLASLADGDSVETILESFPSLSLEDVRAAIAFAAASAEEDLPVPAAPRVQ
jgi:uncharacterized protein (DUF433 family)